MRETKQMGVFQQPARRARSTTDQGAHSARPVAEEKKLGATLEAASSN